MDTLTFEVGFNVSSYEFQYRYLFFSPTWDINQAFNLKDLRHRMKKEMSLWPSLHEQLWEKQASISGDMMHLSTIDIDICIITISIYAQHRKQLVKIKFRVRFDARKNELMSSFPRC